ncbi:MAG: FAD binding domain-containing protein [Gammaproteobacteria bacterium]
MYQFEFHTPSDIDQALQQLRRADDGRFLAGGMTLLPTFKQRLAQPSDLIDLSGIQSLAGIHESDGTLTIGAMTTHADVASSPLVRQKIPALAALAEQIGDPQVRNRGTLGGSVANNDPAADYPAGVLALDATLITDRREIAAQDFFLDMFETALEDDELITACRFDVPKRAGYAKFPNPASRYAIVGVMAADFGDQARVAVTGAAPCAYRMAEMEQALSNDFSACAIASIAVDAKGLNEDIHATPEYRAHLVNVFAQRAVDAALLA